MENNMSDTEKITGVFCTEDAEERTYQFLSQYVDGPNGAPLRKDDSTYKCAIQLLLDNKIFESKEDMRRECLRDYSFILPEFLFPK